MPTLLLERTVCDELTIEQTQSGWAQLALSLSELQDAPPISAGLVAGVAALQQACLDVGRAYRVKSPTYVDAIVSCCRIEEDLELALSRVASEWDSGRSQDSIVTALLIDAMARNQVVERLADVLGLTKWRNDGAFKDMCVKIQEIEAEIPLPSPLKERLGSVFDGPSKHAPTALTEQLRWILETWSEYLSEESRALLLLALDLDSEEAQFRGSGPGPVQLPGLRDSDFGFGAGLIDDGRARFSDDADWMPRLVLIAKQSYVWLDQLSRQYERQIHRLDQIPDEELDLLASRGFTGLWLIGLWERSPASREIKVRRGNSEAESSAYSLRDYAIAERLGGQDALDNLRHRAAQRGLRLAADMVPNHMGLDSRWVAEHPDWFLQLPHPPFPGYSFHGPNISGDDRFEVFLEDGYWDETDAAVVFKHVERHSGRVRFIYHGNDGTQMPWNDTAQLDYLKAEVREAVIQTILEVARRFPVIRFDAAMTLARKHIQRLWYPPPGHGGAIPSRAENSVSVEEFNRLVGGEFWREVVERVRLEVPDTLLLAEAFWMMEGYFVRTLGMHRVYNSAFMHMLRDEDNAGYRGAIKSVMEYSPAILERYVNFMNNPDEETAVEQFGKGDKYFGIATMMATLPGLPMFGHGQFEGYAEKYGMEYTRAYHDETPDQGLIEHHERVISPILRSRHLFSGVEYFALMDFWCDGGVDENVFAYANRSADGAYRSLVIYNNAYESTGGWIKESTAINIGETDAPNLVRRTLGEALNLRGDDGVVYGLWELRRRAWILRTGRQLVEEGLFATLSGYEALVFLDVREISGSGDTLHQLMEELQGGWCSNLEEAIKRHDTPQEVAGDSKKTPDAAIRNEPLTESGALAEETSTSYPTGQPGGEDERS